MPYSTRLDEAFAYAHQLHCEHVRKGTQVPYVSHLMAVAALVAESGGSEDEVIAALLHDGPEDQGGRETLSTIRARFGDGVADIVAACSDTFETPKPPWRERKARYLTHLRDEPAPVHRVSCADKVHNARSIVADLREIGDALWSRFRGGRDGTLWYYRTLLEVYRECGHAPARLVTALAEAVDEMQRLA